LVVRTKRRPPLRTGGGIRIAYAFNLPVLRPARCRTLPVRARRGFATDGTPWQSDSWIIPCLRLSSRQSVHAQAPVIGRRRSSGGRKDHRGVGQHSRTEPRRDPCGAGQTGPDVTRVSV